MREVAVTAVVEEPVRQLVDDLAGLPPGHPSSWDLEELRTGIPALFEISNRLASLQMESWWCAGRRAPHDR